VIAFAFRNNSSILQTKTYLRHCSPAQIKVFKFLRLLDRIIRNTFLIIEFLLRMLIS